MDDDEDPELPDEADIDDSDDPDDLVVCPRCRGRFYEDAVACPHCGHFITEADRVGRTAWWVIGLVFLLLACMMLGLVGLFSRVF